VLCLLPVLLPHHQPLPLNRILCPCCPAAAIRLAEFCAYCLSYCFITSLFCMIERPERRVHEMLPLERVPHVDVFICTFSGECVSECVRDVLEDGGVVTCSLTHLRTPRSTCTNHHRPPTCTPFAPNPSICLQSLWKLWSPPPLPPSTSTGPAASERQSNN